MAVSGNIFDFIGGNNGDWEVKTINAVIGEGLLNVSHLKITPSSLGDTHEGLWVLKGLTSNIRYSVKQEKEQLASIQEGLGRQTATFAALIPIRKSEAWWNLAQDERRQIFENSSKHTEIGLKYLPGIARKLYHCRDIGGEFDFLTWFEFAPSLADEFETLVESLRKTEEWSFVDREIDIRLQKV